MSKRLLEAEDLARLQFVGDPQVSPQKDRVAYVLTKMDFEKDGYSSSIYISEFDGSQVRFTNHDDEKRLIKDFSPNWSPDGKFITFISNLTGCNQVWIRPISDDHEATPLTNLKGNVVEYKWSPDGTKLALTVQEPPEENDSDVIVVTRLRYKLDGVSDFLNTRKHIYLFNLETKESSKLTEGEFDFYGPSFSPDGQTLYYLGTTDEFQEIEYIPSIWQYDFTKMESSLFHQGKGPITALSPSPDGKWVAFIGHDHGECYSKNVDVWAISTASKEVVNLGHTLNRTVDNPVRVDASYDTGAQKVIWDQGSSSLYFTATDQGSIQLYRATLEGEVSEPLSGSKHTITSFTMIDDEKAILVQAHSHSTGDLVLQNINEKKDKKNLTDWNDTLFSEISLSTPEHIIFTGEDGLEFEGWILHPTLRKEGEKQPLVLQIHGGPHSAYGYGFQHEWQLMAARGYAVLYTNPRGSQGYGEDFMKRVVGDWGGEDYKDQMTAVDYVLKKYDYIDRNELFVTGISYGGYMTNIITTRTDRFKAAATQNSVTNLYSMYGTSDIGFYFNGAQLGGADMWEDEEIIMKYSPIRYVRNVKTPTLILHSENDYRCPMEQGEQWYIALRRLGVKTKFVRFPSESHGISSKGKPKHRLERLNHLIGWFEEHRE
ncbi:alpha/beta hydrolase family protein [Neobacillus terrae]|uniref:S9 family peptidase n=1 Tax=Neobacillus terrae TaxID=3034837 RepID=UPI00140ACFFC|nr:S9 family peptidase [Neobacillus terrae]NHM31313.1 S9 family peptidase [Neobacillus terrae]